MILDTCVYFVVDYPMETPIAIFFYSQNNDKFGYLSNFYPCSFRDEHGTQFANTEQYYAYWKCKCFEPDNTALLNSIANEIRPMVVKKVAHAILNFDKDVWDRVCVTIMYNALALKFTQNPDLLEKLVKTGTKQLYEASPIDAIWGIGMSCIQGVKTPSSQYGRNYLGKTLMELRGEFISGKDIVLKIGAPTVPPMTPSLHKDF
jgi:ribA/ribD-fused uncharacterized protein